jgi:hypothetical protein
VAYFNVIFQYFPGGTEENQEELNLGKPTCGLAFESGISQIRKSVKVLSFSTQVRISSVLKIKLKLIIDLVLASVDFKQLIILSLFSFNLINLVESNYFQAI